MTVTGLDGRRFVDSMATRMLPHTGDSKVAVFAGEFTEPCRRRQFGDAANGPVR